MKTNEIAIMIIEDNETANEIVGKYMAPNKVTYVNFVPKDKREKIVGLLEELED